MIASAPESPNISTWPSGGDFATMLAATTPPAPGTFSTMNGLPNAAVNFSASSRAITSGLPPGPEAAISRTGRGPGLVLRRAPVAAAASAIARIAELRCIVVAPIADDAHASPQMSRASSTTSRSFCSCTSGVIGLPVSTLAKPHCGLTARRSRSTKRVASSTRCVSVGLALHRRRLGRDEAEHDGLVPRHEPQRRERAGARRIVFEEIERDVERVEQPLGHRRRSCLRRATGRRGCRGTDACRSACPAGAFLSTRLVTAMYLSISALQSSPRALSQCLHLGIAELGEGGLVDLHVAAAGVGQRRQLLAERLDGVVPELLECRCRRWPAPPRRRRESAARRGPEW